MKKSGSGGKMAINRVGKLRVSAPHPTEEMNPAGIAAVIPAYNEAGRLGRVLDVLLKAGELSEIIVVDDGSSDSTPEEAGAAAARDARVQVLRHPRNLGKGQAVFTGWKASREDLLLLLDADLIHLEARHIQQLIAPVLSGEVEMAIGVFRGGYWRTDLSHRLTPWLSGQRCLRACLMQDVLEKTASGYGLETVLNLTARKKGWRIRYIPWAGVSHPPGELPRGGWHGPGTKLKIFRDILRAWIGFSTGRF